MTDPNEPGAIDNRLSLNPNDPDVAVVKDWQDGKKYRMTVIAQQITPGEFAVLSADGEEADDSDKDASEKPAEEASEPQGDGEAQPVSENPAVNGMME